MFRQWVLAGGLIAFLLLLNLAGERYDRTHPDDIVLVLFLAIASALMTIPEVRIDQGRLTLNEITSGAAAVLLNPLDATVVSLAIVFTVNRRLGLWPMVMSTLIPTIATCLGSIASVAFSGGGSPNLAVRVAAISVVTLANIVLSSTGFGVWERDSPLSVLKRNANPSFAVAFGYNASAALVVSYLLDGSGLGYVLAVIVCVLALAITDSIAGRRIRRVLESELSDADRHLFHSRAVDGVVHNLRNHIANVDAYLREIDPRKLDGIDRDNLSTATIAADDAVAILRTLAQGATPKVSFAPGPVDLNELATQAAGMARARARLKEVQLATRQDLTDVKVRADPLLIREVMTNLVNNAIDAAPRGGHVEIQTGRRNNGWPYVSVTDDGPGIPEDNRHHLFEPHFTTKEGGTGLGLFMSYGVIREHQGEVIYEGSRKGAVFTVTLPPYPPTN